MGSIGGPARLVGECDGRVEGGGSKTQVIRSCRDGRANVASGLVAERARSTTHHGAGTRVGAVGRAIAHAAGSRRRPAMSNRATGGFSDLILSPDLG